MFGLVLSSRPVLTLSSPGASTLSNTQFAFAIPPAPSFSHIVVFMLPGTTLDPDTAAAVYLKMPGAPDFRFLGAIGQGKESAIFRVKGSAGDSSAIGQVDEDAMVDEGVSGANINGASGEAEMVMLGISIEPASQVAASMAQLKTLGGQAEMALVRHTPAPVAVPTKVLAQRIIKNAYDFLASFAGSGPGGAEVVPLKAFQEWWGKFEKRVERDPGFLERAEES
ncbi:DUF775-domain-containing protein [Mytilinidion resinicola]|uniref:DUF775-domain-containing protein n=1 Tax=Mytilinidion resinicola TaxID=574789 RepID=A0A6A6Z6N6_9PEZI|nr:DUF775-domain-containing protein [Mytilinidion resinicola]KAF2816690.1 DUF775-domain-containing protein [Mytilinidion resinicola]